MLLLSNRVSVNPNLLAQPGLTRNLAEKERNESSPWLWVIIAAAILLNLWFDYYHPLGIIIDVIVGLISLGVYLKKS